MSLWKATITFTGEGNPPKPRKVLFRARTFHLACRRVAKYAKRFHPYWRFTLNDMSDYIILK